MAMPTVRLNDGNEIPAIAFGTGSALGGKDATEAVNRALQAGFAHIDTATIYRNEQTVGRAIRESRLDRAELFLTTKYGEGDIQTEIRISLEKLGVGYVDLYLIHLPWLVEKDFAGAWREFVKIKKNGLAKSIGVSNFTVEQLRTIIETGEIKPAVNQIRLHPCNYASQRALLEYSAAHGIVIEAYGSLYPITTAPGSPVARVLAEVAQRIGGTPAQVVFKWVLAKGAVVVTTTGKRARLDEYLAAPELPALLPEEVAAIDAAGAQMETLRFSG
ncbi:Aldo/keto reductase [Artomyces pyxidatus]|uniref:Aldo/keto reductase n=1 Tax=Artomyces pyxidatus TaxID=48021 RepID=A0ACB8SGD1_9AGAM|nr:Aldo/keto reductase [Artomyces pyxidatus]